MAWVYMYIYIYTIWQNTYLYIMYALVYKQWDGGREGGEGGREGEREGETEGDRERD